ncbi:hypothetical protein H9L39_03360 [Fusarium oxysporum f. sp. albedinis]|jgi:hypothetical protein|nr:hypothetical protein H9L39_03360 [Fusarium oxysporum f. sp. albedinis]
MTCLTCERLDTYSIEPTDDCVKDGVKAVASEAVKRRQRLFMVTGVKIARGSVGSFSSLRRVGGGARAGFGGESLGVPFDGGPQFTISRDIYDEETHGESSDFVFAYRVRRIVYPKGGWESMQAGSSIVHYGRCKTDAGASVAIGPSAWPFNSRLEFSECDEAEIPGPLLVVYPSTWQDVCESESKGSVHDGRTEHKVAVFPEVSDYARSSGAGNNVSSEIDGPLLGDDRFVLEEFGHEANLIPFVDDSWEDGLFISFRL